MKALQFNINSIILCLIKTFMIDHCVIQINDSVRILRSNQIYLAATYSYIILLGITLNYVSNYCSSN